MTGGDGCDPSNGGVGIVLFPEPTPSQCGISIALTPTCACLEQAQLVVYSNDPNGPAALNLSGEALLKARSFNQFSVDFARAPCRTCPPGEPSGAGVDFTNTDSVAHTVSGVSLGGSDPGDFAVTGDSCTGQTLAPSQSCSIAMRFSPIQAGQRVALLQVDDGAPGGPHALVLAGTGLGPIVDLTSGPNHTPATALNFGDVRLGSTSPVQFLTLSNTGQEPLRLQALRASGDFRVAAGFSAKSLNLGAYLGAPSAPQQVQLVQRGTAPLHISSIATSGPFTQTSTCPIGTALLASECTITITFQAPASFGTVTGTLTVTDDTPSDSQTLPLSGTVVLSADGRLRHRRRERGCQ